MYLVFTININIICYFLLFYKTIVLLKKIFFIINLQFLKLFKKLILIYLINLYDENNINNIL